MTNSSGVFDIAIGSGSISWPQGVSTVIDNFNNSANFNCGACTGFTCTVSGSTYTPLSTDGRLLRVSFFDGSGWKTISPDTVIRSVPFAGFAQSALKLGTNVANDFILKNEVNNAGSGSTSCDSGSFLTWNAASKKFGCAAVSGATGGTVTNVTVSSPLSVTNGASTPNISLSPATGSQNGYLTSSDWTAFNNKLSTTTAFSGDVSGTASTTSVDKIKGMAISSTAPNTNQVLKFNGSSWEPASDNDSGNTATSTNTANGIVKRDASGNFTAGTITANLTGAASANVLKSGDSMSGSLTHAPGTGNIYSAASGSNTATLQGPAGAIATSYVLRLPTSQSSGTQALVNDGSGNLSWQSLSSGSITSVSATSPLISSGGSTPTLSLAGLNGLGTGNQILGMNSAASGYEYKTVTGTANQVGVSHSANSITLTTPQNIHSGASPTFTGLTLSSLSTAGFVKNNAAGVLSGGNSISATSDISGTLPVANGGTGTTSFANYSVIAANGSGNLTAVGGSSSGSILNWTVTGPAWTTATFPATTSANQLLYSSANNVVGGLATANNSVLVTNGSGVPSFSATSGDLFSQYALLAGRSGGQTLYGGTAASNGITIDSTSNATKGNIILNPSGGNVGIGTTSPGAALHVSSGNIIETNASNTITFFGATNSSNNGLVYIQNSSGVNSVYLNSSGNSYFNGGNVGIGTTSPGSSLTVNGVVETTSGGIKFPDGTTQVTASVGNGFPVGSILTVVTSSCPSGYLPANGAAVSRSSYASLYSAIGTMYGTGDGSTTFNVPDLRGYFLRGWSNGSGNDPDSASRSNRGDGTTGDNVGTKQSFQIQSHSHHISGDARTDFGGGGYAAAVGYSGYEDAGNTDAAGGNETRPKNINVLYCLKY